MRIAEILGENDEATVVSNDQKKIKVKTSDGKTIEMDADKANIGTDKDGKLAMGMDSKQPQNKSTTTNTSSNLKPSLKPVTPGTKIKMQAD